MLVMEQKRVLWIVAAVGLFLLVVIGTALWISSPSVLLDSGVSWSRSDAQLQSFGNATYTADASSLNSSDLLVSEQDGIKQIDFSNSSEGNIQNPVNLNTLEANAKEAAPAETPSAEQPAQSSQTAPASSDSKSSSAGLAQTAVTLNVNITPSSSNASAYAENTQQPAPVSNVQTVQPAATSLTASQQPAPAAPASSASTTAPKTEANTSPKTTSAASSKPAATASSYSSVKPVPVLQPDQFWVQVASFTGKKNAEDARTALAEQKITGEVFTYQDSKGTIYYRLRVGPYKTKSEAEYWHKIIKEIDQFDGTDSYVVNSTVK